MNAAETKMHFKTPLKEVGDGFEPDVDVEV